MKDRIICLVGASGSGKTTIAKELEKRGYNVIQSYTTRKPRYKNEWGHTFIKKAIGHEIKMNKTMIAFKKLYDYEYFATKEQYQGKGTSIYIVDPDGSDQVKHNVKDVEVITIFLNADENVRYHRMVKDRGYGAIERINKDKEIFSKCRCDYVIDANGRVDDIVEQLEIILNNEEEL